MAAAATAALLDLGVLAAAALLGAGRTPGLVEVAVVIGVLLATGNLAVWRWRPPSLIAAGVLLAGALLLGVLGLVHRASETPAVLLALPWSAFLLPAPGHLLPVVMRRLRRRQPLDYEGPPRLAPFVAAALARTPFSPYVLRRELARAAAGTAIARASGHRGDRALVVVTPRGTLPLLPQGPDDGMGLLIKRSLDLALALVLLVVAAPVILAFAVATRLTTPGPAFYSQDRLTLGGRPFRILKIRSMVQDAEPGGRPVWPEADDSRITPLGSFMRRFWIDELPQILNVLSGRMSLVGPRPERPEFAQAFSRQMPRYPLRHQVRAGMTGLAQVRGYIGNTSLPRRLALDLRYVTAWSPWLDLVILARTASRLGLRSRRHAAAEEGAA